jgi:hypothetical protein
MGGGWMVGSAQQTIGCLLFYVCSLTLYQMNIFLREVLRRIVVVPTKAYKS